jgi:hemerythrin-like domain-containing protein
MLADTSIDATRETGNLGATDLRLLKKPLEFILADHHRQRTLCQLLDRLADAALLEPRVAMEVVGFIESDMPIHVIDEEEDLFPLLRRRATSADNVERVLGLLSREHAEDDRLADIIVEGLRRSCAAGATALPADLREALRSFAHRQRRHLAVENAIVMPLAEVRLTTRDQDGLARRMAARRGIQLSPEGHRG